VLHGSQMMLSQETQDLARRLLAYETVAGKSSESTESAIVRVCEKLRPPLCALAGVAGYRSLLSRALALARAQAPGLSAVQINADGSLKGLAEFDPQSDDAPAGEGSVILIAELLGLFLSFLGAALTQQLVQDVSPHFMITTASGTRMPFENILQEVGELNNVSERLQSLADQNPFVEEALMSISGSIRNTATALEVLALIRNTANRLPKNPPRQQPKQRYLM
jgi:hypothetical protein